MMSSACWCAAAAAVSLLQGAHGAAAAHGEPVGQDDGRRARGQDRDASAPGAAAGGGRRPRAAGHRTGGPQNVALGKRP